MRRRKPPLRKERQPGDYALRLVRVQESSCIVALCLSAIIDGLTTHYVQKRSEWCPGPEECPGAIHRVRTQWRGYIAALEWDPDTRLYYPCVLEITEASEVDMRDAYGRGQIWRFTRGPDVDDRPARVVPTLLDTGTEAGLQAAFSLLPVLATVYHRPDVRLGVKNPLPARVITKPVQLEAPPGYAPQAKSEPRTFTPEEREQSRQRMEEFKKMRG